MDKLTTDCPETGSLTTPTQTMTTLTMATTTPTLTMPPLKIATHT
jgi:hypothetical protein